MKDFMAGLLAKSFDDTRIHEFAQSAGELFVESLVERYVPYLDSRTLRLSSLGKYCELELAARYFGMFKEKKDNLNARIKRLLTDGALFEAQLLFELSLMGYEVCDSQVKVEWNGIIGHADFVVESPDGDRYMVDAKTCNDYYFKQLVKTHLTDDRGYVTQLGTYAQALGIPGCMVFKNKDTSELIALFDDGELHRHKNNYGEPNSVTVTKFFEFPELLKSRLDRAKEFLDCLKTFKTFDDVFSKYQPPYPKLEVRNNYGYDHESNRRVKLGEEPVFDADGNVKYYLPSNVSCPELLYETYEGVTSYGKKRVYVSDFKYPEKYSHLKPDLNDVYEAWESHVTEFGS